jgi:hypothetical protein
VKIVAGFREIITGSLEFFQGCGHWNFRVIQYYPKISAGVRPKSGTRDGCLQFVVGICAIVIGQIVFKVKYFEGDETADWLMNWNLRS